MRYQNESDETLVMLTLAGEQSAYEVLVIRYQKVVKASALSVTKKEFMAEDAAQDAFVSAWMKLNTLKDATKYGQWVCRIAKNCAINMIGRYHSFLPLEDIENTQIATDSSLNPAEQYAMDEERDEVNKSVEKLPERVRQIIHLHYYEGLSIAEIADRMRLSEGTVKWQLHDGRKRIRKELCAMNEKYTDTLVQRVMKKVEELKLWQVQNDKSGFEKVYKDVLRSVEELPESKDKSHALADVLMRGWWWLPGEKNDALFARIAGAAMKGKNEEVMTFIVTREESSLYGGARIDFIRDKQIPRLESAGFVKTLGREYFWLGHLLCREGKKAEGNAAFEKVKEILCPSDRYYTLVLIAQEMWRVAEERYKDISQEKSSLSAQAEEYHIIDGEPRYWGENICYEGELEFFSDTSSRIMRSSSCCDGHFFADIPLGETFTGSDGTTLTYLSNSESVDTPIGRFDNCEVWETRRWAYFGKVVSRSYYKDGVGIVRFEHVSDNVTEVKLLSAYEIRGGSGLLPLSVGNRWEYISNSPSDAISHELKIGVSFTDDQKIILGCFENVERLGYDENSWVDAVQEISQDYFCKKEGRWRINDISHAIERAERLAKTPMERAHTKAAASAARRIMATDTTFNPDCTASGHWNFFCRVCVRRKDDSISLCDYNGRWSFEWKHTGVMPGAEEPILFNDVLGILQDATNCIWSDEWRIGSSPIVEYNKWDMNVRTEITCSDGGTVTTKAGIFENCLKLSLDIGGMTEGLSYRGGKKVYYFAEGIGVVRTENEFCSGAKTAVYELTSYEGVGEGYMPVCDGLLRRYDAIDLTDGFVGAVDYEYVADDEGDIVIFSDRTGIRNIPPIITHYSAIEGEMIEQKLWNEGKWREGHAKYAANNFHIFLHTFARPSRNRNNAKRSIALQSYYMNMIELLGEDGEVPPAWYNMYAWMALVKAAALFGDGQVEEGYAALETSIEYCNKVRHFKLGEPLCSGNKEILGDIKLLFNKGLIQLPDGSIEPVSYDYRLNFNINGFLSAITARSGWEWFNSVRDEDRFKEYVTRAEKLVDGLK